MEVFGSITDENGQPVIGAEMRCFIITFGPGSSREIQTDEKGNYTLASIPANTERLSITIMHPDFPSIQKTVTLDTLEGLKKQQDFVLEKGETITGQVTTEEGPLSGVTIRSRMTGQASQSTTTDAAGQYRLLLHKGDQTLIADHPDYAPSSAQISVQEGKTDVVNLILTEGLTISGKVVNKSDTPVAGASVNVYSLIGTSSVSRSAMTDRRGQFEIWGLVEGEVRMSAFHRSYARSNQTQVQSGATDVEIVLQPALFITGSVSDAESNKPLNNYTIFVSTGSISVANSLRVSKLPEGRFKSGPSYAPGTKLTVIALSQEYAWKMVKNIEIDSIVDEGLNFQLSKGVILKGIVVNEDGQPVANAKVQELIPEERYSLSSRLQFLKKSLTDKNGAFTFENVSEDGIDIWVSHKDYTDLRLTVSPEGVDIPIKFYMKSGLSISGRIIRDGKPAEGLSVSARLKVSAQMISRRPMETTDEEGEYKLEHLPPGTYIVSLMSGEKTRQRFHLSTEIELVDKNVELNLDPLGNGTIEGIVVLDGEPSEGARISAYTGEENSEDRKLVGGIFSDAEGRYKLTELPTEQIFLVTTYRDLSTPIDRNKRIRTKDEIDLRKTKNITHRIDLKLELRKTLNIGDVAPEFESNQLNGSSIQLSDYLGKVVLLDFWAVWCAPCLVELPYIKAVYKKYHVEGFEIIGINMDADKKKVEDYVKKEGLEYPQLFDGKIWETEIAKEYGIWSIPHVYLIDREGVIRAKGMRGDALEEEVAKLLRKKQ
ncbi:MAG: carboxypeptidase regulatory-like domain-containing protein [Candidatus Aminicenantes bacterium]|nr:carboxypeptidase regulatory-like domain-containing protein [Candidatus Aminicenantes bacterium]